MACMKVAGERDSYEFTHGFFFNEATSVAGHFPMVLKPAYEVIDILGLDFSLENPEEPELKTLFERLMETKLPQTWKQAVDNNNESSELSPEPDEINLNA